MDLSIMVDSNLPTTMSDGNALLEFKGETYCKGTLLIELQNLENYREIMTKMEKMLGHIKMPFEGVNGDNRFEGPDDLEELAEDYIKIKFKMRLLQNVFDD
tara:strand:- start:1855 stop:2157 length:303 start_codon:yes stop_codon:yes gene_type:complete